MDLLDMSQACGLYKDHDNCPGETTLGTKRCACECHEDRRIAEALASPAFNQQLKTIAKKLWATHPNNPLNKKNT